MDQTKTRKLYDKTVCISPGIQRDVSILKKIIGRLGGFPETTYDKTTNIIFFSDQLLKDLKSGNKCPFIQQLEDDINQDHTPYIDLLFAAEKGIIDYLSQGYERTIQNWKEHIKKLLEKDPNSDVSDFEHRIIINKKDKDILTGYKESEKQIDDSKKLSLFSK
jgi:hypothetical protein